jgi:hypothetical protein
MPEGIQTRIAGCAAGWKAPRTRGWKNVFQDGLDKGIPSGEKRRLSFPLWNKVEKERSQAGDHASLVETLNFGSHGAQVALPQSPILRVCAHILWTTIYKRKMGKLEKR